MQITLFACPKPFQGHTDIIQRNAILSWMHLDPRPEIILLGVDAGVAEICKEFNLIHIPDVDKNEYGTPLVNSVFQIGQVMASAPVVCYINSDIMVTNDFLRAIETIIVKIPRFLVLGQRTDIEISESWDFKSSNWEIDLKSLLANKGVLHAPSGIDFFCFPKGMYSNVPAFAIGRLAWDNWLVWRAWSMGVPIIDVTKFVTIAHQNHNYDPTKIKIISPKGTKHKEQKLSLKDEIIFDGNLVELGPEAIQNRALVSDDKNLNIWGAGWMLNARGALKKRLLNPSLPYIIYLIKVVIPLNWPVFRPLIIWMKKIWNARRRTKNIVRPGLNIL